MRRSKLMRIESIIDHLELVLFLDSPSRNDKGW